MVAGTIQSNQTAFPTCVNYADEVHLGRQRRTGFRHVRTRALTSATTRALAVGPTDRPAR
jgi:hypothetical protein